MVQNQSMLTDLYQITMAYGYWKNNLHNREAVFQLYFRRNPFGGKYTVAAGLALAIDYLQHLHFTENDVTWLGSLKGNDSEPLFEEAFLNALQRFKFTCDVEAVPEGELVFPNEPMIRVTGPIWQAQLVETSLLNLINFSSLIATKASRVVQAANGDQVLEFGLRRAQGIDGGLTASRSAYIGGCNATSNVLAAKLYGVPVKGTHAHSWVMSHDNELDSFDAWADAMPNNCSLLVDTYNTLHGVENAIEAGVKLKAKGYPLQSIRLDSGDLLNLSIEARKRLDEAGFHQTQIIASNDLDEYLIADLKSKGAKIDVWGVGTKLVTAFDQPVLGGVYKLGAIKNEAGDWEYKAKISEESVKSSIPGVLQVRREYNEAGIPIKDILYDDWSPKYFPDNTKPLLQPIFRTGKLIYQSPNIHSIRTQCLKNVQNFNPQTQDYPVIIDDILLKRKEQLITQNQIHHHLINH